MFKCGFYGAVSLAGILEGDSESFNRLGSLLKHRVPDDSGDYRDEIVLIGFNRLSIVAILLGNQPMSNSGNSIILGRNGAIYNYQELRSHLEDLGYLFQTSSDIECSLSGYQEYGNQFFSGLGNVCGRDLRSKKIKAINLDQSDKPTQSEDHLLDCF